MGSEGEGINTEGSGVSTRPSAAGTGDEHLGPLSHVPGASTSLAVGPRGDLPRTEGYVRLGSDKYNEWRVLAYSRSRDSDLYKADDEIYKRWLAAQPSVVERVPYTTPTKILRRPSESSEGSMSDRHDQAGCAAATTASSPEMGLLKAGIIAFSDSPWASPIVIVPKKNGVDIRLCIDYKLVNSVTAIMEYATPLVDDLLTDMEKYLWYCSLDAASGFWAVMMTQRIGRSLRLFVHWGILSGFECHLD
ncbi:unnamed protein product [Phytophthora fragariaefolia]|uniref:Unnamed protein product n=1 Tax=Phytophthora fragariaefolia TaxID=1490495 RepID=A0A9W6XNC9_9STRA|nr:unnamed protein product [Phytophthora fragariaefolia]